MNKASQAVADTRVRWPIQPHDDGPTAGGPASVSSLHDIEGSRRPGDLVRPEVHVHATQIPRMEVSMPRAAGDRYVCEKCGAELVYEKGCPCPPGMPHSEICCGEQMKKK
jgi:hypothetical protein